MFSPPTREVRSNASKKLLYIMERNPPRSQSCCARKDWAPTPRCWCLMCHTLLRAADDLFQESAAGLAACMRFQHTQASMKPGGTTYSPEFELVLACLRWPQEDVDGDRIQSLARQPIRWPYLLEIVHHHKVVPLFSRNLESFAPG